MPASAENEPLGGEGTDLREEMEADADGFLLMDAANEPFVGAGTGLFPGRLLETVSSLVGSTKLSIVVTFAVRADCT